MEVAYAQTYQDWWKRAHCLPISHCSSLMPSKSYWFLLLFNIIRDCFLMPLLACFLFDYLLVDHSFVTPMLSPKINVHVQCACSLLPCRSPAWAHLQCSSPLPVCMQLSPWSGPYSTVLSSVLSWEVEWSFLQPWMLPSPHLAVALCGRTAQAWMRLNIYAAVVLFCR